MATMGEVIRHCRQNLGSPPRQFPPEERRSFRLRPSFQVRFRMLLGRDKLRLILDDQDLLRDGGRVVWGFLVQANNVLFDPANRLVLPANVIYSPDQSFDGRVSVLEGIAHKLFELKGTSPRDKELRRLARRDHRRTAADDAIAATWIALREQGSLLYDLPRPAVASP